VSNKTVAKLLADAGDMAIARMTNMSGLRVERIQADEIWSFVAAKAKNVNFMENTVVGAGTVWAYLAMCADTKLIFAYQLGDRRVYDATKFMRPVSNKLARNVHGEFEVRPTVITDGLPAYVEAGSIAFGEDANRAMLIKQYSDLDDSGEPRPSSRYVGSERKRLSGSPAQAEIHTSYIERQNLNLRMGVRRYNRRTNAFSKSLRYHERHLALWLLYNNYCRIPCPSRVWSHETGAIEWQKRLPPAMAAGLTERPWEIDDIIDLTDKFVEQRNAEITQSTSDQSKPSELPFLPPPYWVYRSELHYTAKIHAAHCSSCRDGKGKKESAKPTGRWHPAASLEEAYSLAAELEPDRHSICRICLGSYSTLGYRHSGSSRSLPKHS
jgi:IS1 family transposase